MNSNESREKKRVDRGIDEYLNQFSSSPYSYPPNDRQTVKGVSTLKGSWEEPKKL